MSKSSSRRAYLLTAIAVLFAAAIGLPSAKAVNIVANGSFENGNFQNTTGNYDQLPVNSTDLTGWTVIQNSVAWGVNPTDWTASDGVAYVDLTGIGTESPYGGLSQTLNTTAAQQYLFSFDVSGSISLATVSVNGAPIQLSAGPSFMRGSVIWTPETSSFTASGPQTVLDIVGTGNPGSLLIGVDNVSATSATVPDASSTWMPLLLSLAATFGLNLWLRRQSV
jgi:Protein of unknown function (DUF642)